MKHSWPSPVIIMNKPKTRTKHATNIKIRAFRENHATRTKTAVIGFLTNGHHVRLSFIISGHDGHKFRQNKTAKKDEARRKIALSISFDEVQRRVVFWDLGSQHCVSHRNSTPVTIAFHFRHIICLFHYIPQFRRHRDICFS